jgi:hypothetical protein
VFAALLAIDCLNLVQSGSWTDPSGAPHLSAVHQVRKAGESPVRRTVGPGPSLPPSAGPIAAPSAGVLLAALVVRRVPVVPGRPTRSRAPPTASASRDPFRSDAEEIPCLSRLSPMSP